MAMGLGHVPSTAPRNLLMKISLSHMTVLVY